MKLISKYMKKIRLYIKDKLATLGKYIKKKLYKLLSCLAKKFK